MNDPSLQGRPADALPQTWNNAISALSSLSQLAELSTNYTQSWLDKFITADPAMLKLKQTVRLLASLHTINTVLVTGPSGHGKELIARALHWRPSRPFVAVNCASLPDTLLTSLLFGHERGTFTGATESRPGVFEAADDGTVFLDEIGDMPEAQQPVLLRILQEREVTRLGSTTPISLKCRIVAATHSPDKLRHDLYGRLMGAELAITPLTQRTEDIKLICNALNIEPPDPSCAGDVLEMYGVRYLQSLATKKLISL